MLLLLIDKEKMQRAAALALRDAIEELICDDS